MKPSGIRIGTPAVTTRGMKEKDVEQVAEFIARALALHVGEQVCPNPEGFNQLKKEVSCLQPQLPPAPLTPCVPTCFPAVPPLRRNRLFRV